MSIYESILMKECFIVTPIGESNSAIRREIDALITTVFEPILTSFDLKVTVAHQISETGSITRQVIKRLIESDLVIANLTNLNPNVMYELGIRHCTRKPTIVIAREDVVLPFDISDERTIFYKNDIGGVNELKKALESILPSALEDIKPDNPVYRVVDVDLIKIPEGTLDSDVLLNRRLEQLENHLDEISRNLRSNSRKSDSTTTSDPKFSKAYSYYVDEINLSKFVAYYELGGLSAKYQLVYKEQYKLTVTATTIDQAVWVETYEKTHNLKRI
ncbi:TPA: hypothetical protein ACGU7N_002418 [Vibrio vulnificus]